VREQIRHAFTEVVGPAPHRPERPQAGVVEELERVEARVDRLCAFEVDDRRQRLFSHARAQFADMTRDTHLAARVALEPVQMPSSARAMRWA